MYSDDIKIVDVYKRAAQEMLCISQAAEDEVQQVKVVTVGKSDYRLENLQTVTAKTPVPLEKDLYVKDSREQKILAGAMPEKLRYGEVGANYKDKRKKPIFVNVGRDNDVDAFDDAAININSLRYQINGEETPIDYNDCNIVISGDGWYILVKNNGLVENGIIKLDEDTKKEYETHLSRYKDINPSYAEEHFVRKLTPQKPRKVGDD